VSEPAVQDLVRVLEFDILFADLLDQRGIVGRTTIEYQRRFQFIEGSERGGKVVGDDGFVAPRREKIAQR